VSLTNLGSWCPWFAHECDLGPDPVTGKQRYSPKTVRGGKRAAERGLAEMISEAERGRSVRTSSTVGELLEAWFEFAARDFSPKTVKETRGFIDRNLLPALGHVPLARLTVNDLDRYYQRLRVNGGHAGGGLAPGTIRLDPACVLARAASEAPALACFLSLAAATGDRRSELIALRWTDINLGARTVSIERGVVVGMDGLVEKDTKSHAARRVSLDDLTVTQLADHAARMAARAEIAGTHLAPDSLVFSNTADGSRPWSPDSVSRSFKRLCSLEGLTGVRLHDLRHFVATELLSAGVDIRTVAGRLGHRNAATTLNVYAHFLQQADRSAADIIGDVIGEHRKTPKPVDGFDTSP
jgi:integrase